MAQPPWSCGVAARSTPHWPKYDWVEQAFRDRRYTTHRATEAHELGELDLKCDLVVLANRSFAGRWPNIKDVARNHRAIWVYWWFDLIFQKPSRPIDEQPYFREFENHFRASDAVLVKERPLVGPLREVGVNAYWMDQACPSCLPEAGEGEKRWDVLLWGQNDAMYRQRRQDVQCLLDAGFRVAWAGAARMRGVEVLERVPPLEIPSLAQHARCLLSVGARNDIDGYWSDSFWLACGTGVPVVRRETPGMPMGPYWSYRTREGLVESVREASATPEAGRECRQWVMKNHVYENRVESLIHMLTRTAGTAVETAG